MARANTGPRARAWQLLASAASVSAPLSYAALVSAPDQQWPHSCDTSAPTRARSAGARTVSSAKGRERCEG
jgi:hypothetical protein